MASVKTVTWVVTPYRWSEWHDVIVPNPVAGHRSAYYVERVSIGFRMKTERLEHLFLRYLKGVYEWRIRNGNEARVMYVGKSESLYERIKDYCQNGSHKANEFDTALRNGYTLEVRVAYVNNPDSAETEILATRQYPWNVQQ